MKKTFEELLTSIAMKHDHLDWIADTGEFRNPSEAIEALETHIECLSETGNSRQIDETEMAIYRIEDFVDMLKWEPSEQDYRECCGIWIDHKFKSERITPDELAKNFINRKDFNIRWRIGRCKVESIPEQCVPKYEIVKERYNIPYPMLAGVK